MAEITFVLLGAVLVMYGWYWAGVTESRTTAAAVGLPAAILAGIAIFQSDDVTIWSLAALGAGFGVMVALTAWWDMAADRTVGLYALLAGAGAILSLSAILNATNELDNNSFTAIVMAIAYGLVFISAGLVPDNRGFRNFVGWAVLIAGAVIAFFGFAAALDVNISTA